jgi:protein subunit release factor B
MNPNPPGLDDDPLRRRMAALGVVEADLEETFVRSGGHGGQNVNKTSTCVLLVHRPTGVQVKCQDSRQQGQNRLTALHRLLDKLEALRRDKAAAERAEREKQRRQARKPSRGDKNRMLADKARHARKKQARRAGSDD